jgi:predicted nucleic acid-binding protein
MAKILSIDNILPPSTNYPIDIIFVDTNVIVNYEDPFGFVKPQKNADIVSLLNNLKSNYRVCSTIVSAIEFYKFLQVGYYNIYIKTHPGNFEESSTIAFKKLKGRDQEFLKGWELRLKMFVKTFKKHFPAFDVKGESIYSEELITSFDGKSVDFADEIIYHYSKKIKNSVIITEDRDFQSFPDDVRLVIP